MRSVTPLGQIKLIKPSSPWVPSAAFEDLFICLDSKERKAVGALLMKSPGDRFIALSGSLGNFSSKALQDAMLGATAFTAATPLYVGLWAAALDDTSTGATASESAYTSYARHSMTNNTTNFAAGTGTTTYVKTFPSDAVHSFAASTGTGTNNTITYLALLNGNAGTSADKLYLWCSVTSTTINSGDTPQLAQNAVSVTQD